MKAKDIILIIMMWILAVMLLMVGLPAMFTVSFFFVFMPALAILVIYKAIKKARTLKAAAQKAKEDEMARQKEAVRHEKLIRRKAAEDAARQAEIARIEAAAAEKERQRIQAVKENPAEMERLANMCADISAEYKQLLKKYQNLDISEDNDIDSMVHILKECYRKMDVIATTISTYRVAVALDPWNEIEKIEKKAKAFINGYIRQQRNNDFFDYEIDVLQFANDLDFINDYIYDKDDKLNRE